MTNVPVVVVTMPTVAAVESDDMADVTVVTSAVAPSVGLSSALVVVCDFVGLSVTHTDTD